MRAIRAVTSILPARVVQRVDRLLVRDQPVGPEPFEYDAATKRAEFACLGEPDDPEARDQALRELLLGFARVDSEAKFGIQLEETERAAFASLVAEWYPRCAELVTREARGKG